MAKKGIIALLSCVFALSLALVGCGGGNNEAANKAAFVGTWDLVEMSQDGQVTGSDDLETLKSLGLEVYVNFNEDGTMVLALFGEPLDGTWEATSTTAGKIEMQGQAIEMTIADSKLTFAQEGASLTFQKGEAKEAPTGSSNSEAESSEAESAASEAESSEAAASEAAASESTEGESTASESAASESAESSSSSAAA